MPNLAFVEATIRSHDRTISHPPARAAPSTAAMIGLVRSRLAMPAKPPLGVCRLAGLAGGDRLEVGAGGEDRALAGENADPDLVVGLELVDGRLDALGDVAVDRVAGLGPVDGDEGDVPLRLVGDHPPKLGQSSAGRSGTSSGSSASGTSTPGASAAGVSVVVATGSSVTGTGAATGSRRRDRLGGDRLGGDRRLRSIAPRRRRAAEGAALGRASATAGAGRDVAIGSRWRRNGQAQHRRQRRDSTSCLTSGDEQWLAGFGWQAQRLHRTAHWRGHDGFEHRSPTIGGDVRRERRARRPRQA